MNHSWSCTVPETRETTSWYYLTSLYISSIFGLVLYLSDPKVSLFWNLNLFSEYDIMKLILIIAHVLFNVFSLISLIGNRTFSLISFHLNFNNTTTVNHSFSHLISSMLVLWGINVCFYIRTFFLREHKFLICQESLLFSRFVKKLIRYCIEWILNTFCEEVSSMFYVVENTHIS